MAAATVWWAQTDWRSIGNTGVTYNFPAGTLGGRVIGQGSQSGKFFLSLSYWMPKTNFPSSGCRFRSTPAANLSGDAMVSTLMGEMFLGFIELSAPRAQCQLRATQEIFAGPSLLISGTLLHNIASVSRRLPELHGPPSVPALPDARLRPGSNPGPRNPARAQLREQCRALEPDLVGLPRHLRDQHRAVGHRFDFLAAGRCQRRPPCSFAALLRHSRNA